MVVNEDDYIYVYTERIYILHLIERNFQADTTNYVSYSHSPLCALNEAVF